jgi:SAM-dependent methyltransferase
MKEIKLNAADNLTPIRQQMTDLIKPDSRVVEFGCGNGDLLFKLSNKIKYGLGIDKSKTLIEYAKYQKKRNNISNIDFVCEELGVHYNHSDTYDFSTASLFFHVIPTSEAVYLINKMREISNQMLICGFSCPDTLQHKLVMWLDQRFSRHYQNFVAYQKFGYLEGTIEKTQCSNIRTYNTHVPFVKIYKLN